MRASSAGFGTKRSIFPIKFKGSIGKYLLRIRVKPPVEQVKMMRSFMHQQAATVGLNPMPSTEIVCPMGGIQVPMKIDRGHLPNSSFLQEFVEFLTMRGVAVIKGDQHLLPRSLFRIQNCLHFRFIRGHRLFSDHMHSRFQSLDYKFMVGAIHGRHDHHIWTGFMEHLIKIQEQGTIHLQVLLPEAHSPFVLIR